MNALWAELVNLDSRTMSEQADRAVNGHGVVSANVYDWLQYQDNPELTSTGQSRKESFISMNTVNKWKNLFWSTPEQVGVFNSSSTPPENEYEIQHSVFKPIRGYTHAIKGSCDAEREHFQYIVSECIEAIRTYHIEPQRIQTGSSGSYFVYGTTSAAPLGVFKPKDEEPYGPLSPKWTKWCHRTFFPCFFGRSCLIPNLGYICESAASLLDSRLRTNLVPWTDTVVLESTSFYDKRRSWLLLGVCNVEPRKQNKLGSFQLFLTDYVGADEFLNKYPLPGMFRDRLPHVQRLATNEFHWDNENLQKFRLELEKLVILDYLMRNTDRGLDNWMVKTTKLGNGSWEIKLAAIDNGLSFPWKHPDEWRSYPYGWLYLPVNILSQPFSEQTRKHFLPLLTSTSWWEDSFNQFTELFSRDNEFKWRMWKKQWSIIKGQAFNVVETLRNPMQGPLELVRRTRCVVIDEYMEVPASELPMSILRGAMNETIPISSSPMVLSAPSVDQEENWRHYLNGEITDETWETQAEASENYDATELSPLMEDEESHPFVPAPTTKTRHTKKSKTVVIERLQLVTSKPPVFTWW